MRGRIDPAALQDKIIIVAMTGLGLSDYKTNARGDLLPGVDTHAQMIESFFDGAFLRRPQWMRWAEVAAFAACSLLTIWLLPRVRLRAGVPMAVALGVAMFGAGALLFARRPAVRCRRRGAGLRRHLSEPVDQHAGRRGARPQTV
jgi:CHASE2 domain-containing sensor protein